MTRLDYLKVETISRVATFTAFILAVAWSGLTIYLAVSLPITQLSTYGLSLTAAVVDTVGLGILTLFMLSRSSAIISNNYRIQFTILGAIGILGLLGLSLTLAMLGYTITRAKQDPHVQVTASLKSIVVADLVLAPLAVIAQGSFLALHRPSKRPSTDHETLHSRMQSDLGIYPEPSQREATKSTSRMALQRFAQPCTGDAAITSPTGSPRSSLATSSLRHSLHQVIKPVTSKTRLFKRLSSRDSKSVCSIPYSIETSPSDGFDMWDTSMVTEQDKETILCSQATGLETIPGSRPVSPARALDGPFPEESSPRAESIEAALPPSPTTEQQRQRNYTPTASSIRSQTIRESRSSTPDESHIHPLFRSDSPAPPSTTPGTIITASPQGGQTLSGEQMRVRSNSRPSRPSSRLAHSHSFDSTMAPDRRRSEAPPIPGFVLAEGAFIGTEPRGRASSAASVRSRAVSTRSDRTARIAESLISERWEDESLAEE
ncbi:MAG: hypothetical protein Q9165_000063 [Trypethelium subeluteriae]